MTPATARRVAAHHAAAAHTPTDPATAAAYRVLIVETLEQYRAAVADGFRFTFTSSDPYATSAELFADYRAGGFRVFRTEPGSMPDDHPLAVPAFTEPGLIVNDIFRAVHDYFGHCQTGAGFGPRGEDTAYVAHRAQYSAAAWPALAAETRCQNSWFNFGPHSHLAAADRPFSPQLAYAAPLWIVNA